MSDILIPVPSGIGSRTVGIDNLVNLVNQFGVDNTGTVNDNSARLSSALITLTQEGLGGFIPSPGGNQPAVTKIANTVVVGNGGASPSTYQGPIFVGAGWPSWYAMVPETPFQQGYATLQWTGAAGGTMFEILGPLMGWGLSNLQFYAGSANQAGCGVKLLSASTGRGENLGFYGFTGQAHTGGGGALWEDVNSSAPGPSYNSMHNCWKNLYFYVPTQSTGIAIGPTNGLSSIGNVCYEHFEDVGFNVGAAGTAGSPTTCLWLSQCDTCYFDKFHYAGNPPWDGSTLISVMWYVFSGSGWPDNCVLFEHDFNPHSNNNGFSVPNAFAVGAKNLVTAPGHANGIPYPAFGVSNIVWDDPMIVFPQSAFSQPGVPSSTTALANPTPVNMVVIVTGGTVSAIAVNGTATGVSLASGASATFVLKPGQTITLTYSVAPTWYWYPL
ncbi:MAG TPA: hypothetical protein VEJ84_05840 [Acidimicrobiales bacterium]|nr:hypothetical protein [Acidimicrobiales bacterium]